MRKKRYFTVFEICLWSVSVVLITVFFCVFDRRNLLYLFASLIGVTSLIFAAKGNPVSPLLMIVFSVLYGVISYTFRYYGEMITYLGMTLPMSVFALVAWLKNPYEGKRSAVKVNVIQPKEWLLLMGLTVGVTMGFYFLLRALDTPNLIVGTISVTTSFAAAYLTARRSVYFSLAYAANDIVLIVLWVLAMEKNIEYISVFLCFCIFLINDLYTFICWARMRKTQKEGTETK